MPAFKPDSSFFRKIVLGTIGSRAVCADMNRRGHHMFELERGSTDTKLWKDVKRKRVRIPDLICTNCGARVESRAKSKAELSMSHSPTEIERSWDFGMVDSDIIAYPVCSAIGEKYWSSGKLNSDASYWHERNWVKWQPERHINFFKVSNFRSVSFVTLARKGVTEGSELTIAWPAIFATYDGVVSTVDGLKIKIQRESDKRSFSRTVKEGQQVSVQPGQRVALNAVIASAVQPLSADDLRCPGQLPERHIDQLLRSRERTQRFTGIKLARLRDDNGHCDFVAALVADAEEDLYVRLEGIAYLAAVCGKPLANLIATYSASPDPQTQLEAVITLGETNTVEAGHLLSGILDDPVMPYFLRSAAAWGLSRMAGSEPIRRLIHAFNDVDLDIRQEALDGVVHIGGAATPLLLESLRQPHNEAIAAGCAEALRQHGLEYELPLDEVAQLLGPGASHWSVWLAGNLPKEHIAAAVLPLQETNPQLHYAITVLWSFMESWISRRWEIRPTAKFPENNQ